MAWWNRRAKPVPEAASPGAAPWPPEVAGALALRLLGVVEEQRETLDTLQRDEDDPKVLERLYRLDHGNARARRLVRGLQVLSGSSDGYGGPAATLQDVLAMATGMVGQYQRVTTDETGDLAAYVAPPHLAEDLALLLAELLDNGTRYGGAVTTGVYRLEDGSFAVYVRDTGTGCPPEWMARVNSWLAGTVQPVIAENGRHGGLTIVHHLARRHGVQVNVSVAPPGQDAPGTVVTVFVPAHLLQPAPTAPIPAAMTPPPGEPVTPPDAFAGAADLPRRTPGAAYTGAEDPGRPAESTPPYEPFTQGATLADLAAAFSTDPRERPQ
ncbi:ATP-binding protein [Actinocorallia sp. A-T 12471]|uniref:sensor histidine kinase n=1 Tax=Actinocorallia sp. A-T 12471 TaxID=3089813 RepID=UPI0029D1A866|nr:ATP-binding protein [Actinocorallia sp. A-T 12471]MDX6744776.1 ATP-binding protein [Actinocorallia sp. A-T 12471]